jgi:hypothetical protein
MPTCRSCGIELTERRRQMCPICWPVSRNAQAKTMHGSGLAQRHAAGAKGEDPTQTPQARARRRHTLVARKADEAAWAASEAPTTITRKNS